MIPRLPDRRPAAPRTGVSGRTALALCLGIAASCPLAAGEASSRWNETLGGARRMVEAGEHRAAEALARELLVMAENAYGTESEEVADVLDVLVDLLCRSGRAAERESHRLGSRALEIREAAAEVPGPEVAVSVENLACLAWSQGDYDAARDLLERALKIREAALGPRHVEVASNLANLAVVLRNLGEFEEARKHYERALPILEERRGPEHPEVAAALSNLAIVLRNLGRYAAAMESAERSLRIREKYLGPEHPTLVYNLNVLARLLQATGEPAKARGLYERAAAICDQHLAPEHPNVAVISNNLAELLHAVGEKDRARELYERAAALWEANLGREHPYLGTVLNNLARLAHETGDVRLSRRFYERALAVRERSLGPDHPFVATTLNDFASLLQTTGDEARAEELLARSLEIRQAALGRWHPGVAEVLHNLARLRFLRGEPAAAWRHAVSATGIRWQHVRNTIATFPEQQALRYAVSGGESLDLTLSIALASRTAEADVAAWDAVVRSRAMVLDEVVWRRRLTRDVGDPAIRDSWQEYAAAGKRLANLYVRGPRDERPEVYKRLIEEARRDQVRAESALARGSAVFRRRTKRNQVGWEEVVAALPPASALVGYVSYERLAPGGDPPPGGDPSRSEGRRDGSPAAWVSTPSYLAFVHNSGEKAPRVIDLGPAAGIDARVRAWRDQLSRHSERRFRRAGRRLREAVWDPLEPLLAGSRQIFVVPDGELLRVHLATLPDGEAGYLVEREAVLHHLSCERDLVSFRSGAGDPGPLLAAGAADFDASPAPSRTSEQDPPPRRQAFPEGEIFPLEPFGELSETEREIREVAAIWREAHGPGNPRRTPAGVRLLLGAAAGETAFKELAPRHRVLHLATHGFFLDHRCPVAGEGDGRSPSEAAAGDCRPLDRENPLLRSGLALAGANRRRQAAAGEDDGVLTAEEIAVMDLSGVEWAVLSACETGSGRVRAREGVFGLRRAFRLAGARTLILSLWKVEDEATRRWMRALYRARFLDGLATADAVRRASLESLEKLRRQGRSTHPFFWGAFVAEGDWR